MSSASKSIGDVLVQAVLDNAKNVLTQNSAQINTLSEEGYTPLYIACMKSGVHIETLQLLLKLGAVVDLKGQDRETPLYIASHNNNVAFVKILLQAGAQVNEVNGPEQDTCLHLAAKFGYVDLLLLLLQSGANINVRNARMETPLFAASKFGKHEAVYQLLLNNANPNFTNEDGKSALYIASEKGMKHVVLVLKAEPKYLKEAKAAADVELKMRPASVPTSDQLNARASAGRKRDTPAVPLTAAASPAEAPKAGGAKAAAGTSAKPAAAPSSSSSKKQPAAAGSAASTPAPPLQKMEIIPIEIPKMVIRDHDPITGESKGPCRSLDEVGYDEPPPIPKGMVLKPVVPVRVGGTSMKVGTGTDIEGVKARQLDMLPTDDAVDYTGVILPRQK